MALLQAHVDAAEDRAILSLWLTHFEDGIQHPQQRLGLDEDMSDGRFIVADDRELFVIDAAQLARLNAAAHVHGPGADIHAEVHALAD